MRRVARARQRSSAPPARAPGSASGDSAARIRWSILAAPASSVSTSIPAAAAGNRPTAVSTEKRPSTSAGTGERRGSPRR